MNCMYLKIRTKKGVKYGYCSLRKNEVALFGCKCGDLAIKSSTCSSIKRKPLKVSKNAFSGRVKKSSRVVKLERSRTWSLLTQDMSRCYVCGAPRECIHEIYFGNNRLNSMKYHCIVPLCTYHHNGSGDGVHFNSVIDRRLKIECQLAFVRYYPDLDFLSIFHKSYVL